MALAGLLKAEMAAREVRSLAYQMKVARFPAHRDLNGFDFSCSDVSEATVRQLSRLLSKLYERTSVIIMNRPGMNCPPRVGQLVRRMRTRATGSMPNINVK